MTVAAPTAGARSPWLLWIVAAAAVLTVAGAVLPLTDGDSAYYATIARDALRSREWLVFSTRGGGVFDKPPLTTWLLELSIALFGSAEWAVRMWHVGLALATVLVTYHLARLALSASRSLLASLIMLTSGQFFYQSLVPQQDIPVTLFVTLAVYWYLRWARDARLWMAALAGVSTAFAVLCKGLFGAILPVLIIAAHLGLDRPAWPKTWARDVGTAIVAFLVVGAPWFVIVGLRQGQAFVDTFLLGGALGIGRFFHPVLSAPGTGTTLAGFLAYVIFLPLGLLPWTGWLWPGLREGWRARGSGPSVLRVCTVWVITIVAFLTISPGDKVIRYLLPVLPAASVLVASAASDDRWLRIAGRTSLALGGLFAAVLVGLVMQPLPADSTLYRPVAQAFLVPLTVGLVGGGILALRARRVEALVFLIAMTLVAYGMLVASTARQWDRISPWRPIGRTVNAISGPNISVLVLGERSPFAEFYIERPVAFVDRQTLASAWQAGRVIAVLPVEALSAISDGMPPVVVSSAAGRLLVIRNF
jgi:4-amino-4-deoxy-L-arabinose transferase-like glycosyltransferase